MEDDINDNIKAPELKILFYFKKYDKKDKDNNRFRTFRISILDKYSPEVFGETIINEAKSIEQLIVFSFSVYNKDYKNKWIQELFYRLEHTYSNIEIIYSPCETPIVIENSSIEAIKCVAHWVDGGEIDTEIGVRNYYIEDGTLYVDAVIYANLQAIPIEDAPATAWQAVIYFAIN